MKDYLEDVAFVQRKGCEGLSKVGLVWEER